MFIIKSSNTHAHEITCFRPLDQRLLELIIVVVSLKIYFDSQNSRLRKLDPILPKRNNRLSVDENVSGHLITCFRIHDDMLPERN